MQDYEIIIQKENLLLLQKNNKIKLEIKSKVKSNCNVIDDIKSNLFYKILYKLNEDLIDKIKIINKVDNLDNIDSQDITIFLKSLYNNGDSDSDDNDKKYYITFDSKIIYDNNNINYICINGEKNLNQIEKSDYKKINVENIFIKINVENDILTLKMKIITSQNTMPIYVITLFGKIITKMFNRLLKYYN